MKDYRITELEITPINVSYTHPEVWSYGSAPGFTSLIVQIHTESGVTGIGEAVSGGPSILAMLTALQELAPLLHGQDALSIRSIMRRLRIAGGWHWYGRRSAVVLAGIEMALWDLLGKALQAPVCNLLGGALQADLPYMYFLQRGAKSISELIEEAQEHVGNGFNTVYVKGTTDTESDIELLTRLREHFGPGLRLRIDLNESWTPGTAVRTLRRLEPLNLEFVEQPLRFSDVDQLARLRVATCVPIAANQTSWTGSEVLNVISKGAADVIVTDAHQEGGISDFCRTIDICEVAGLPVVYHAFTTLTLGMTASMHAMITRPNCLEMAHQAYAPGFVQGDIATEVIDVSTGRARVPTKPGLGVELDIDKFAKAARRFQEEGEYSFFDASSVPAWVPMG